MAESELYKKGAAMRRQLMGDAAVERSAREIYSDPVMKKFIDVATETVFGAQIGVGLGGDQVADRARLHGHETKLQLAAFARLEVADVVFQFGAGRMFHACGDVFDERHAGGRAAARIGDSKMNWRPPSKNARFEGDAGMSDLRHRLSLDPDVVPQPPARSQGGPVGRSSLVKISLCVGLVAIVTYTVVEINLPYIDRSIAPNDASITKTARLIATSAEIQSMAGTRLVVENRQAFTDEPLPFGVVLAGATGGGSVFLNALVKGTRLSAGDWLGPVNGLTCLDTTGKPVAWAREQKVEGTLAPLRPLRALRALTPLRPLRPMTPLRPLTPLAPLGGWSGLEWPGWIGGFDE